CETPHAKLCNARRFMVAAYTERRVLVEGWAYTRRAKYGGHGAPGYDSRTAPFWDPALLALNDGFLSHPTAAAARKLYGLGVRWVFVDRTVGPGTSLVPYASLRMKKPTVVVWQLRRR
ncbi:MAG: hypothetical protein M3Z50_00035, partial [Actinomycetota bacterium]|nr:hypothetical protein [Actinomycetota bacterium]